MQRPRTRATVSTTSQTPASQSPRIAASTSGVAGRAADPPITPTPLPPPSKKKRSIALKYLNINKLIARPSSLSDTINKAADSFGLDTGSVALEFWVEGEWFEVSEDSWETDAVADPDPLKLRVVSLKKATRKRGATVGSEEESDSEQEQPAKKYKEASSPESSPGIPEIWPLPTPGPLKIIIQGQTSEQTIDLRVNFYDTVEIIKKRISNRLHLRVSDQRLIFGDSQLEDGRTIQSLGIQMNSVLYLVMRLVGKKPVIYLFPPAPLTNATVKLTLSPDWNFSVIYPRAEITQHKLGWTSTSWNVSASTKSKLTELSSGIVVSYLFWEAKTVGTLLPPSPPLPPINLTSHALLPPSFNPNFATLTPENSMLLSLDDLDKHLHATLTSLTLHTDARTNFVTFWREDFERIEKSGKHIAFRFIEQEAYEQAAKLEVEPKPDVVTRVFMVFKGVEANEAWSKSRFDWREVVGVQEAATDLTKFRVLEWGGMEVLN
ncbi:hypothetical protein P7C70_g1717, partial [Phenoliferia sp. Uapishka_3]